MLIKSATDMSGIITRELTMGIISLVLIFVSIAAVLLYFKQQLKDRKKRLFANPLSLLRIALELPTSGRPSCIGCIQQTPARQGHYSDQKRSADVYRSRNRIWRKLPKHFPNPKSNICVKPKQH